MESPWEPLEMYLNIYILNIEPLPKIYSIISLEPSIYYDLLEETKYKSRQREKKHEYQENNKNRTK